MKPARWIVGFFILAGAGCVGPMPRYRVREVQPGGLNQEEVVRMAKAGLSDAVIIEKLKTDGVASRLTSDQIVSLKNEGVSDAVVEAMVSAPVVPASKTVEYVYYPSDYPYYYGYGYGYPYYSGWYGAGWYGGYYPYGYYHGWHYPYSSRYYGPSYSHARYR